MKTTKAFLICILTIFFIFQVGIVNSQFEDDEFEEELDSTPCLPESLVTIYDKNNNPTIAYQEIRKFYSFGSEYHKNKDYKSALPYLWNVFINDTTRYAKPAIRKVADSYFNLEMGDSTLLACYRGLERFPNYASLHYFAGFLQDKSGKFRCAIPHYEILVRDNPENKSYLEKLAFLLFKDEDERSIEIQQKLVNLEPTNDTYNENLFSYTNYFLGEGGALEVRKQAYDSDPSNKEFALTYGVAACEAGQYKEAVKPLSEVIKSDKNNVKAYEARAICYESMEKFTSAINDLKKVVNIEPNNVEIMCTIATNYKYMNQFTNGKYWIGRALKAKPGYGLAYITMAEIYEAAVSYCQDKEKRKINYDDKLVYELARNEYRKATKDSNFRSTANSRIKSLATVVRTKEDIFMNQNRTKLKEKCFTSWIK